MKGNIWVIYIMLLMLFSTGFIFVFYSKKVRNYYFKSFKRGIETTDMFTYWIDKYPKAWFFKLFGFASFAFGIAIIFIVFWKR